MAKVVAVLGYGNLDTSRIERRDRKPIPAELLRLVKPIPVVDCCRAMRPVLPTGAERSEKIRGRNVSSTSD